MEGGPLTSTRILLVLPWVSRNRRFALKLKGLEMPIRLAADTIGVEKFRAESRTISREPDALFFGSMRG